MEVGKIVVSVSEYFTTSYKVSQLLQADLLVVF